MPDLSSDKASFYSRLRMLSESRTSQKPADAPGPAREWHVSARGRDGRAGTARHPLATIQEAVDNARPGDRIIVGSGSFAGAKIEKGGISIAGACGRTEITGIGDDKRMGFVIGPSIGRVGISHLSFKGVRFPVFASGLKDSEISNLDISGCFQGIVCISCEGCYIAHNRISGAEGAEGETDRPSGIFLAGCPGYGPALKGNSVAFNRITGAAGIGISIGSLDLATVSGNRVFCNMVELPRTGVGISVFDCTGNAVRGNCVKSNHLSGCGTPLEIDGVEPGLNEIG